FAGLTIILGAVYMLNAYRKIVLGENKSVGSIFIDLNISEKCVLVPIVVLIFWMGICPNFFLDISEPSLKVLREIIIKPRGPMLDAL
nr:hypothetical protein [Bacteroidia bacterium]